MENCTITGFIQSSNHPKKFDFATINATLTSALEKCSSNSTIFFPGTKMFTEETCQALTGESHSVLSWTPYPVMDIWTRMVTWKLPLIQLLSQFPRPPLGFSAELFTLSHLLGDPIDCITSMLLTLNLCTSRVQQSKNRCGELPQSLWPSAPDRDWKVLTLIMISYDECGKNEIASKITDEYCALRNDPTIAKSELRHCYEKVADSLAADRQTKFLPMTLAELIFIGSWLISFLRASSSEPQPSNWINIEVHSIAFSTLYLWLTPAIIVGSVIGASQTELAIPRILQQFEKDISSLRHIPNMQSEPSLQDWGTSRSHRVLYGGLYSWRPNKWRSQRKVGSSSQEHRDDSTTRTVVVLSTVAFIVVGVNYMFASILSVRVPPVGPSCRNIAEGSIFLLWVISFLINFILEASRMKSLFWAVLVKDTIFTAVNIALMLVFQWGVMNRCACWTKWGRVGLHLPQMWDIKVELMAGIKGEYRNYILIVILLQLLFCAVVAWIYRNAIRVYLQRDDGESNIGSFGTSQQNSALARRTRTRRESKYGQGGVLRDRSGPNVWFNARPLRAWIRRRGTRSVTHDNGYGEGSFELPLISAGDYTDWDSIPGLNNEEHEDIDSHHRRTESLHHPRS